MDGAVAVLANRAAGRRGRTDPLPAVLERLRAADRPVRVLDAADPAAARQACQAAVADGAAALVAVGGDGTVHQAIQAAAGTTVPFGVVPAGTGNDFAADLGLPADSTAAAAALAAALRHGETRPLDLARMTGPGGETRWFGAVLAAGFDAVVNERANRMRFPTGPRRYDVAILAELLKLRPRPYTMTLDGVEHRTEAVLVAIGNTARYGGGMRICPGADPADGLLDVVVGGRFTRGMLMRIKPKVYRGSHIAHPLVTTYRAATVELAGEPITTFVDGEPAFRLPVTVTAVPGALRLLVPPPA